MSDLGSEYLRRAKAVVDRGFVKVHHATPYTEERVQVAGLGQLKVGPRDVPGDAFEPTIIHTIQILPCHGESAKGELDAVFDWCLKAGIQLRGANTQLFWRREPELEMEVDHQSGTPIYRVYSRMGAI